MKTLLAPVMRSFPTDLRPFDTLWHCLYAKVGGGGYEAGPEDALWPERLYTARLASGFRARLNLRDWLERRAFFSGNYYQLSLERLMEALIRPGDTWIDVGANLGLVSLYAASLIGKTGRGFAFEPNPEIYKRLVDHLTTNRIRNFTHFNLALGESRGKATLNVPKHSGQGSLVAQAGSTYQVEVPIVTGDDVLDVSKDSAVIIKIDVEGYEPWVLRGMPKILSHPNCAVIIEVIESHLRRAGTSSEAVLEGLARHGFEPFVFELVNQRFAKLLKVRPLDKLPADFEGDLVFLKPGALANRVK